MMSRGRQVWSTGSARFARDVLASVVATGIATAALSYVTREDVPSATFAQPGGKAVDRLSWDVEDVPARQTRIYDTLAMFAMPQPEPVEWSDTPPVPARLADASPVRPGGRRTAEVRIGSDAAHRAVASLTRPPNRPAPNHPDEAAVVADATSFEPAHAVRVFGWPVPGTERLPNLPSAAMRQVAALGDGAAALGGSIAETVGLR